MRRIEDWQGDPTAYELVIPDPIGRVFSAREVYCVAACCQLHAYKLDVDYLACISRVLPDEIATAARQLDEMIAAVGAVDEAVDSLEFHFCCTWPTGAECAAYPGQWREALSRAVHAGARRGSAAAPCVRRRAQQRAWQGAVIELLREARLLLHFGYRERFATLMRAVIALDDGEQSPLCQQFDSAKDSLASGVDGGIESNRRPRFDAGWAHHLSYRYC